MLKAPLDVDALYPFGCLAIHHKAKEQCDDGYLDQRGELGAFVGWAWQDGVKGIAICLISFYKFHDKHQARYYTLYYLSLMMYYDDDASNT